MDQQALEQLVRKAVHDVLGTEPAPQVCPRVTLVRGTEVGLQKFEPVPGGGVRLADMISSSHGASMAVGLMEVRECAFDWTLNYEEIEYVLEGTLDIIVDGKATRGYKGDAIYIPRGTHIQFSSPDRALFLYCTYPADWTAQ